MTAAQVRASDVDKSRAKQLFKLWWTQVNMSKWAFVNEEEFGATAQSISWNAQLNAIWMRLRLNATLTSHLMDEVPESAWILRQLPHDRKDEIEARSRNSGIFGLAVLCWALTVFVSAAFGIIAQLAPLPIRIVFGQFGFVTLVASYLWVVIAITSCNEYGWIKYLNLAIYFLPLSMLAMVCSVLITSFVLREIASDVGNPVLMFVLSILPHPIISVPIFTLGVVVIIYGLNAIGVLFPREFQFDPDQDSRRSDIGKLMKLTALTAVLFAAVPLVIRFFIYAGLRPGEYVALAAFTVMQVMFSRLQEKKIAVKISAFLIQAIFVALTLASHAMVLQWSAIAVILSWISGTFAGYYSWRSVNNICVGWLSACGWQLPNGWQQRSLKSMSK